MFTIGVFQDVAWADRGLAALVADGFDPASISVLARATSGADSLIQQHLGAAADQVELPRLGAAVACGPLLETLRGRDRALESSGLARACARAGFQHHDGHIFQTLVERGGVLVAVQSVSRAADALARLHAYGGGNAAIGVYTTVP